jgi:hypothetical protein
MSMWVADERNAARQIYNQLQVETRQTDPANILRFWYVEFNTSLDGAVRGDNRDFVAYVRNFVALRNAANPTSLMQQPLAGIPPPPPPGSSGPSVPGNLRITSGP